MPSPDALRRTTRNRNITMKTEHTLADLLILYLEMLEIEYIFGIPGGAIEPLYSALTRSSKRGSIRPIIARHESGAAFMADGYARETGKFGVCCATTGPGTTNLITAIASSHLDNIPVLAITAQTMLSTSGRGAFQESSFDAIDTVGMLKSCTLYSSAITHPEQFELKLTAALIAAMREPKGPVHLSIPIDIFRMPAPQQPSFPNFSTILNQQPVLIDNATLDRLCQFMRESKKTVILVGQRACSARQQVLEFAKLMSAIIVTTPQAKSCIDSYSLHNFGVFGFAGHQSAIDIMNDPEVELIIGCGSNFLEWSTNNWDSNSIMNSKLAVIDISPTSFQRTPMAKLHVYGDITEIFNILLIRTKEAIDIGKIKPMKLPELEPPLNSENIHDRRKREKYRCAPRHIQIEQAEKYRANGNISPIKPQRLMCELNQHFPPETRFLADTGNSFSWSTHYLFRGHQGAYRLAMGFATMGWAIGAAIGTALGNRSSPVVAIIGDGSFLMNGLEISVAVAERVPVIFVVLNDHAFGMVRHGQILTGVEPVGCDLPETDFAAIGRALGGQGYNIRETDDFAKIDYQQICTGTLPTVLDISLDREEIPPMGMRLETLNYPIDF